MSSRQKNGNKSYAKLNSEAISYSQPEEIFIGALKTFPDGFWATQV